MKKLVEAYTLVEINNILINKGKSLKEKNGMPLSDSYLLRDIGNYLLNEDLDYATKELKNMTNYSQC